MPPYQIPPPPLCKAPVALVALWWRDPFTAQVQSARPVLSHPSPIISKAWKAGAFRLPAEQMRKPRLKEMKRFAQIARPEGGSARTQRQIQLIGRSLP